MRKTDITSGGSPPLSDHGLLPPFRVKSRAGYVSYYYPTHLIAIVDLNYNGVISVTNDIENVLYDMLAMFIICGMSGFLADCTLVYRDSDGLWDQIVIDKTGSFLAFEPIRVRSLIDAVRTVAGDEYNKYESDFLAINEME